MSVKKRDNLSISTWIRRFSHLLPLDGSVLDLAAGGGRHSAWFLERGLAVTALDRTVDKLERLKSTCTGDDHRRFDIIQADLEDGSTWPLRDRTFDAVIVVNYLHRPLNPDLLGSLAPDGLLLYDTFAVGNEAFGKPANPDFLLRSGELLDVVRDELQVIAFEQGRIDQPNGPAVKQRIAAIKARAPQPLSSP